MQIINIKRIISFVVLLSLAVLTPSSLQAARAADKNQPPELPPMCGALQVPPGYKMAFQAYAIGVQIYRWNGTRWDFVAPSAKLFADPDYRAFVGDHFAGPTWQSDSGGTVVAARVDGCTPEAAAIPWLLLKSVSNGGIGVFGKTTFIQRVNTVGGVEPAVPGTSVGTYQKVPYIAEYYFYQAQD